MLVALLFVTVAALAFTNGANANFKGVATLYASGTLTRNQAAWLGTLATLAGSITSVFLSAALLQAFSGRGLVPPAVTTSLPFLCSVAMGAALTSFLATRLGYPISTTHALVGALVGAGYASGEAVVLQPLLMVFVLPLLLSPFVAALLSMLLRGHYKRKLNAGWLHIAFAALASFARGLNDTPKMASLLLLVFVDNSIGAILFVAVFIALGGWLDIRNVAETLGKRITVLSHHEGILASFSTATLVIAASFFGLPVSTTHVSVGSMLGQGVWNRGVFWKKIAEVVLAWITTVPIAAMFGLLLRLLMPNVQG
jgi:inorganic phosphate transporter, PiT family